MGLSACFVPGFSAVFITLGAGASAPGSWLLTWRTELNLVGGATIILFGLVMLRLPVFARDTRFNLDLPGGRPSAASRSGGGVMVVMGVAAMTGQMTRRAYWLPERFPSLSLTPRWRGWPNGHYPTSKRHDPRRHRVGQARQIVLCQSASDDFHQGHRRPRPVLFVPRVVMQFHQTVGQRH